MLTFKIAYTAFVLLVVAIWWRHYSWRNFLWFSDIAFIGAVPALWLQSSALASVLAVAVLVPEILWNVDFVARLALRRRITGLTDYMFEPERPRLLRGLSLFHGLGVPILLGASRKRFIGVLTGVERPEDRVAGTLAVHLAGVQHGARLVRAHDVAAHRQALAMWHHVAR